MSKLSDIINNIYRYGEGQLSVGDNFTLAYAERQIKDLMLELLAGDVPANNLPAELTGNSCAQYLNGMLRSLRQKVNDL